MMNLTSQYAMQALIFLARQDDSQLTPGARIAEGTGVPAKYLSTILGELVRCRILESTRGKGGGFKLARPANEIMLYSALQSFEPVLASQRPCPFGKSACSDDDPCTGHERWKVVRQAYNGFLNSTTIADVAACDDALPPSV
jgi:Rrf2 family iron-sulfur cluster assembly transcriptional regulator